MLGLMDAICNAKYEWQNNAFGFRTPLNWKMVCDDELELEVTWFYLSPRQQFKTCVIRKMSKIVIFPKPLKIEM